MFTILEFKLINVKFNLSKRIIIAKKYYNISKMDDVFVPE